MNEIYVYLFWIVLIAAIVEGFIIHVKNQNIKGVSRDRTQLKQHIGEISASFSKLETELRGKIFDLKSSEKQEKENNESLKNQMKSLTDEFYTLNLEKVTLETQFKQLNHCYDGLCSAIKLEEEHRIKFPLSPEMEKQISDTFNELSNEFPVEKKDEKKVKQNVG